MQPRPDAEAHDRVSRFSMWLAGGAFLWAMSLLQWGQPLTWDEIEFFRATRWIAEGRLPFRDYWEHHLPLQWVLFAPAAFLFSDGAGTGAVVALRWAQLPLWIGAFAIAMNLARTARLQMRWGALVLLLVSPWFVRTAIQYRVDVPAHLAYVGAVALLAGATQEKWRSFLAGALFSLAVLSNMRLAPLVVLTVLVVAFWCAPQRRWRWNGAVLRVIGGGAAVAALFLSLLAATGATSGFLEGVIWYNTTADRFVPDEASSFLRRLAAPLLQKDPGGTLFLFAGAAGATIALRDIRRPGPLQIIALLALGSLATIVPMAVHYEYHFQTSAILLLPLAALALGQVPRAAPLVPAVAALLLAVNATAMLLPEARAAIRYQDRVMHEVDRRTRPDEPVWDGCGYALRRDPAYRYWFLPAGVRLLADERLIENYDLEQIESNPPAAIIFNERLRNWMVGRPRLAAYVTHHYVPVYRNLWLPGMSAAVGPEPSQVTWSVLRSGRYDVYASEILASHPWFTRPLDYGWMEGPELSIPLQRLPPAQSPQWRVDGVVVDGSSTLELKKGSKVELLWLPRRRLGVMIVPHGIHTMSVMPESALVF